LTPEDLYDPENDGEYVSESLGVHEHWDTDENIFSLDRYSGPSNDGIDYIAVSGGILLADADGPYYGAVNEPIQFNGFATGGSPPYQYLWEFGDGHTSDDKHPTHNYENSGIYSVTLTVTDADQSVATDDTTATINTPPNKPTITGTTSGKPGVGYIYGFTSTDSDDDDVSYYIKWGDGDATDWTAFQASGPPGYSDGHAWDEQGTYTIEAKAKDIHGAVSEWAELTVTMPRNRATSNSLFLRFLEQFPLLERLLYLIE
jgi:PKD repeat protein